MRWCLRENVAEKEQCHCEEVTALYHDSTKWNSQQTKLRHTHSNRYRAAKLKIWFHSKFMANRINSECKTSGSCEKRKKNGKEKRKFFLASSSCSWCRSVSLAQLIVFYYFLSKWLSVVFFTLVTHNFVPIQIVSAYTALQRCSA